MTLEIDDIFLKIDKVYSKKYGSDWLNKFNYLKYLDIREKYINASKEEQKAFNNGELLF